MKRNPFLPYSVAMITPFNDQEELDITGIISLVNYYKKNNVPALLISGSTGEQHSMSIDERKTLFFEVKKAANEDLILYGGVAAVRTKDAIELATSAEEAGLDGIMLGFPPYIRMSQKEAYQYVEKICEATTLPIMLYNNPPRTGFHLETSTLLDLVRAFPQIVALKEAGDPSTVPFVKEKLGQKFTVLSGSDLAIFENDKYQFNGLTSIIGNIFPKEMQLVIHSLYTNDEETARKIFFHIEPLMKTILEMGALRTIKYLLVQKNVQAGICREPLSTLNEAEKTKINSLFKIET